MAGAPSKSAKFFRNEMNRVKYDRIVCAFRDEPGNFRQAGLKAGVDWRTARKGWLKGWPDLDFPPIKEVIIDEQMESRSQAEIEKRNEQREEAERALQREVEVKDRARADAIAARKAEADLVRANRGNTIALVSITGRVLRGALKNAEELERAFANGQDTDGKKLSVSQRIQLIDKLARTVERASRAARDTMAMERTLLGEPTEIIGVTSLDYSDDHETYREIEELATAAQRARERKEQREKRLRLIKGGRAAASKVAASGTGGKG